MDLRERFSQHTVPGPDGCIDWTGYRNGHGYGLVQWVGLPSKSAHRIAYWLAHDELPKVVRHSCDRPCCVNPDHLLGGTQADNVADMVERRRHWAHERTHCANGHSYEEFGVRYGTRGDGSRFRICKECDRINTHKRRKPGVRGPKRQDRW